MDLPNENLDRRVIEKLKRKIVIAENTNLRTTPTAATLLSEY